MPDAAALRCGCLAMERVNPRERIAIDALHLS